MNKISPELLQKIKSSVNLLEVVGEHVVLRKSGSHFVGLCPFHSERSPSFFVNETKQLYHCYGCKRGGDLLSFIMETFGISFPEALEEIAERAKIALPKNYFGSGEEGMDPEAQKRLAENREKKSLAFKLNRFAASFYHQNLLQTPQVDQYFKTRGVQEELARQFYVGAAHRHWDSLANHLKEKKAPLSLALELGLIRPSPKRPGEYFDLFRSRALFPILDLRGKVAGFGGRKLPQLNEGVSAEEEGPKYLNSPESLLYRKDKLAFGLYQAQKHIREKDELIVVEGYFDVLALHAAGFQNAVSTCGTALSPYHLQLFKRFCNRIIILFDGDTAGIDATNRAMETALEEGMVLHGVLLPDELDPDEILFDLKSGKTLEGGKERLKSLLEGARPLLDNRIELEIANAGLGPEAKTQALKRLGSLISRLNDPVGREIRIEKITSRLGVSRTLFQKTMGNPSIGKQTPRNSPISVIVAPNSHSNSIPQREKIILFALLLKNNFNKLLEEIRTKLPPEHGFKDLFESREVASFLKDLDCDHLPSLEHLLTFCKKDSEIKTILSEASFSTTPPYSTEETELALYRSTGRLWARFSQQIKLAITQVEAKQNTGLQSKLMKDYLDVQRKMKEFNRFYDES